MFNAERFLSDNNIESSKKNKWAKKGWLQIRCPFCTGHPGWHGGFNIAEGYYNCRRCGYHWLPKVVATLADTTIPGADRILKSGIYGAEKSYLKPSNKRISRIQPSKISFPPGTKPYLIPEHRAYLESRRFNPSKLEIQWSLMSTSHIGDYSHRILAPIFFEGRTISYQCRATKMAQNPPYLACAGRNEVMAHKDIIYGFDHAIRLRQCVIVEGITDVWRLGPGAVATFGKDFTWSQVRLIANNFDSIFVLPDSDVKKEDTITLPLQQMGKEVEEFELAKGDPDDLTQDQADKLMKKLGF